MTIYNLEGDEIQTPEPAEPQRRRDYRPAPGRVTVLRQLADRKIRHGTLELDKAEPYADRDDNFNIYATVAVVGDQLPHGIAPFFERGDTVTIIPSMFDEVKLADNLTVWAGPFSAVTGVFVEPEEAIAPE